MRLTKCVFDYDDLGQASALRETTGAGQLVLRAITEELTCIHDAGAGVDNLGSECYGAVVGVGAPNTADKEDELACRMRWNAEYRCRASLPSSEA